VPQFEDVDETGKARQKEVGRGDRYKPSRPGDSSFPEAEEDSLPYLNITEVESALGVATSAPYTAFTQLIPLPNLTWEGRPDQCDQDRPTVAIPAARACHFLSGMGRKLMPARVRALPRLQRFPHATESTPTPTSPCLKEAKAEYADAVSKSPVAFILRPLS